MTCRYQELSQCQTHENRVILAEREMTGQVSTCEMGAQYMSEVKLQFMLKKKRMMCYND